MLSIWKSYFSLKQNRLNFALTLSLLIIVLIILPRFLNYIENRNGFSFDDPILRLFNPVDVTWLTFALIYIGIVIAVFHLAGKPNILILAMKVYAVTAIIRMIAMYLLPLNPPSTLILLDDPFVQFFGSGEVLTKDLFFSGHTSTMFILFLTAQDKKIKYIFLTATLLVALAVIVQHVHYTIDVYAAPFFAYAAYSLAKKFDSFLEPNSL